MAARPATRAETKAMGGCSQPIVIKQRGFRVLYKNVGVFFLLLWRYQSGGGPVRTGLNLW